MKNQTTKTEIKNVQKENLKDVQIDNINLDKFLNKIQSKNLNSKKETLGKRELYKKSLKDFTKDSEYKSYKRKMRKQLESFCNNIQFFFVQNQDLKTNNELKNTIDLFNKFYKENYILNDLSEESLRFNNADDSTKENIKDTLQILKHLKIFK